MTYSFLALLLTILIASTTSFRIPVVPRHNPHASSDSSPGVRLLIENSGINQALNDARKQIVDQIKETSFEDQQMKVHAGIAGDVDITLKDIHFSKVEINELKASFEKPNVVSVATSGVTVHLKLKYHFRQESFPHAKGSGDVEAKSDAAEATVAVMTALREDQPGKPKFTATTVDISLGDMDVDVHGGASWILSLLENLFKDKIQSTIEFTLKNTITDVIDVQLNDVIGAVPFVVPVSIPQLEADLDIDLSLTSQPSVVVGQKGKALMLDTKAETYISGKHVEPPFQPAKLPEDVSSPNDDATVYVTEFISNDVAWQLFNAGKLKYTLTDDMIPKESPIHLNTTDLKNYIPELYEKFPNQLVVIDLSANESPSVTFTNAGGLSTVANTSSTFSVVNASGDTQKAFIMDTYVSGSLPAFSIDPTAAGDGINITGKVNPFKIAMKLEESFIGDVNVQRINVIVNSLINNGLVPDLSDQLKQGIVLKAPAGIKVDHTKFQFQDGFIGFGAKVEYSPAIGTPLYRFKRRVFMSKREQHIMSKYKCDEGTNHRKLECQVFWDMFYGRA